MARNKRHISLKRRFFRRVFWLVFLLVVVLFFSQPVLTPRDALDRNLDYIMFPPYTVLQEGSTASWSGWDTFSQSETWYTFSGGGYAGFCIIYRMGSSWNSYNLVTVSLEESPISIGRGSSTSYLVYCAQPAETVELWYENKACHWTSLSLGDGLFLLYPDFTRTDVSPAALDFGPGIRVAALDAEGQTVCELILGDDYSRYMMF